MYNGRWLSIRNILAFLHEDLILLDNYSLYYDFGMDYSLRKERHSQQKKSNKSNNNISSLGEVVIIIWPNAIF